MTLTTLGISAFPSYAFGPSSWIDFASGSKREWLVANGIGGYASSTIIGANTRSYHGLLVASLQPPVDRQVLLAKVEEEIVVGETTYSLSTNQYRDKIHPAGFRHLVSFSQNPFPTWLFNMEGTILKKWLFMRNGKNTTVLGYELMEGARDADLYLLLFVTKRNFHHLLRSDSKKFEQEKNTNGLSVSLTNSPPFLHLYATKGDYYRNGEWYYNFQYVRDKERGLDFEEDLFHPGTFAIKLAPGERAFIAASAEPLTIIEGEKWQEEEEARLRKTIERLPVSDPQAQKLALSADAFIVARNGGKSVIAGYPWFNDWGRDAFISIPGLFLVTGRAEEAKDVLIAATRQTKNGLIPCSFPDSKGISPSYNSVDTSLWFIHAVYRTWEYTRDKNFLQQVFPAILSILETYRKGKETFAKAGDDHLLYAGHPETPLTWMDAKVGHWVVTPRNGAAVEVNALWHNSLKIAEEFCRILADARAAEYSRLAEQVAASFAGRFWNAEEQSLYDYLAPQYSDLSVRPNQLFALSLPFRLLPKEKEEKIFKKVAKQLYTPYGLRTLDSKDKNYKGIYHGDRWLRDGAYHQGTAWPWLLGPFATAMVRIEGESARPKVLQLLSPLLSHLYDAGIGQISEIFCGDFPHQPAGCIAQSWSLAEILRAYVEEGLGIKP